MADQVLMIDANDLRRFFLRVEGDAVTIGFDPANPDGALRNLRVKAIRCELDIADDPVILSAEDAADVALESDEERRIGSARLRVLPTLGSVEEIEDAEGPAAGHRLVVVNGADTGRVFAVDKAGVTRIGKDAKAADVTLNDLYVAQVHCELESVAGRVFVSHLNGSGGTCVNGQKIGDRTEIQVGDVVRVGNSHLKLELGEPKAPTEAAAPVAGRGNDIWSSEEPTDRGRRHAPAPSAAPSPPALAPPPPPAPAPPRVTSALDKMRSLENQLFAHFQIGERLGRGHVGSVFRATDLKTHHTVSLKILLPDFPKTDAELQTFSRVLKIAPTLRDSHLVTLLGVGRTAPYTWISREYVEGDSLANDLAEYALEGRSSWKRACRVGAQIAAALDVLHQHKVAHLELTPSNVLVRRVDGSVKLSNFLLAQALQGSQLWKETREEKLLEEMPYLAPEQLAGSATPDFRCDLYALGVLCYELAVGRPPFVGDTVDELKEEIAAGKIAKPSRAHKEIPPPFEAVILKLLARDPAARCREVGEFLDVVGPILTMHDIG